MLPVIAWFGAVSAHPLPAPLAPSTLPDAYLDGDPYLRHRGPVLLFDYRDTRDDPPPRAPCRPRDADAGDERIDWCALSPYVQRYEPQVPVPWRSYRSW